MDGVKLQYIKKNLKEYIKTLTKEELEELKQEINEKYTGESKTDIVHEIELEKKERALAKYISSMTCDFLRDEFSNVFDDVDENKINKSLQHYNNIKVDADNLIKWCPIALDVDACYKIYNHMHLEGKTDSEIIKLLTENYKNAKKEVQNGQTNNNSTIEEFNEFIKNSDEMLRHSKAGTESYDKYIKRIMNQNKEVMRKLA